MSELTIRLLGPPLVEVDGKPIDVDTRKAIALLAYLVVEKETQRRSTLATLLWPDSDQGRARTALRRTLTTLRKAIGEEWLDADRHTLTLQRRPELSVDLDRFQALLDGCAPFEEGVEVDCLRCIPILQEAVDLYRGNFLEGFTLTDSFEFDDWQRFQSETWQQKQSIALQRLADCLCDQKRYSEAVDWLRRRLALDALSEPAHQALMRVYALAGQRSAAIRQYESCKELLYEELGVEPQTETTALYERILRGELEAKPHPVAEGGPASAPQLEPLVSNLPRHLTAFVGREKEREEIHRLLDDHGSCLVTVLGPGGIGKTRLCLQIAVEREAEYKDGVHFVPLGPVNTPDHLIPAIAEVLHFTFFGGDSEALKVQLLDFLREKELLLLLDNFEHLLDGAPILAEILHYAPGVQILVTSQERLNVMGEWIVEIHGLECPNGNPAEIDRCSAVQLFVQRAGQVATHFSFGEEEKPHVAKICRLVGGMPLGIELASTWVRVLSCREIARQIEQSLDFLATSTLRDVPDRHRSLRAVFEHSWRLLSDEERDVFRRFSVFRGGFDTAAAQHVADCSPHALLALADKSLLQRRAEGRFDIPEVLRQYAVEKFQADLDETRQKAIQARYYEYFAAFLEDREPDLTGEQQIASLAEIGREIENVREAWRLAVAHGKRSAIARMMPALYRFYDTRSWFQEGEEALGQAVALFSQDDVNRLQLARALSRYGRLQVRLTRLEDGSESLQRSLEIFRSLDAHRDGAKVQSILGVVADMQGDYDRARVLQEASLSIWRELGDQLGIARSLLRLGNVAYASGDHEEAQSFYGQSLEFGREIGDRRGVALSLNNLGSVAETLGEYEEARALYRESVTIKRDLGDRRGVAYSLNNLGYVDILGGKHEEAGPHLQESLAIFREIGDRKGLAYTLTNLGNAAHAAQRYEEARELYGKSLDVCRELAFPVGTAHALKGLGNIDRDLGDTASARQKYQQALEVTLSARALPVLLDIMVEVAIMLAGKGETQEAAELTALILKHPAKREQTRHEAEALLAELSAELPERIMAEVRARADEKELEVVAATLLAE